jgi:Sulfotransferase family
MPIFRINDQLHYFAHVPKCGGSSVDAYLAERFGRLGFTGFGPPQVAGHQFWNRSAAQHIPLAALYSLVPPDWFASSFAVVRHPVRRLISAFLYTRDVFQSVPLDASIDTWAKTAVTWIESDPCGRGCHVLPQTALVPEAARIFRLEDGLEPIVPYLDDIAGNTDGPREIPTLNVGKWRREEAPPQPNAETLRLIAKVYAADFARFGYEAPASPTEAAALTDLPVLAATGAPPTPKHRTLAQRLQRSLMRKAGL